jgi:hypothetical protein
LVESVTCVRPSIGGFWSVQPAAFAAPGRDHDPDGDQRRDAEDRAHDDPVRAPALCRRRLGLLAREALLAALLLLFLAARHPAAG